MFDMNVLWEKFVFVSLKKHLNGLRVSGQSSLGFWRPERGRVRTIRPDIVISSELDNYVLDTKRKLVNNRPSLTDIRQMYAYHHYWGAKKVAMIYPGGGENVVGKFEKNKFNYEPQEMGCGLIFFPSSFRIKHWQKNIAEDISNRLFV